MQTQRHLPAQLATLVLALIFALSLPTAALAADGNTRVWKTETGSKYHSTDSCGRTNPKKARQVTLKDAVEKYNLGRCSKCSAPSYDKNATKATAKPKATDKPKSTSKAETTAKPNTNTKLKTTAKAAASSKVPSTVKTTSKTSLYVEADKDSKVLASIPAGTELTVESQTRYFYEVEYAGKTGFVRKANAE